MLTLAFTLFPSSFAQAAVYSYQGNNFTRVSGPPYTTEMNISGSFELALPLPPNVPLSAVPRGSIMSFSFFDGVETRTEADSVICGFEVATDIHGRIVQWNIWMRESGIAVGDPQHTVAILRSAFEAEDQGDHIQATGDDCAASNGATLTVLDSGNNFNQPGTWTSDVGPVPTLPIWSVVLLSGLLALLGIAALRRARACPDSVGTEVRP